MFGSLENKNTMIGSLPHRTPEQAFELLDKYPLTIPAWPQLPKRSFKETMVPQYSEGFPGILIDEKNKKIRLNRDDDLMNSMTEFYEKIAAKDLDAFAISENFAAGFHLFLDKLKNNNEKLPVIKGQVTGPFTFGLGINDNENRAIWFDKQYRDIVLKGLTMKALWQINELKKYAEKVVLFLDEPILSALGTPAYISIDNETVISSLNELIGAAQAEGTIVGIHCCGNMDWALLAQTKLDIINFDAYDYGDKVALYPEEISSFLNRGGILAWGIVPTIGLPGEESKIHKENANSLKQKLEGLIETFVKKGIPEEQIQKQKILTPSCGMGSLSTEDAELVLNLLSQAS